MCSNLFIYMRDYISVMHWLSSCASCLRSRLDDDDDEGLWGFESESESNTTDGARALSSHWPSKLWGRKKTRPYLPQNHTFQPRLFVLMRWNEIWVVTWIQRCRMNYVNILFILARSFASTLNSVLATSLALSLWTTSIHSRDPAPSSWRMVRKP